MFGPRCDDGVVKSLVLPRVVEGCPLLVVGKVSVVKTKSPNCIRKDSTLIKCPFLRTWMKQRYILHLSSGNLVLRYMTFLVADNELVCEDLLNGLPILQHLKVDKRTMLEYNQERH